jgi:hypothetical protein
VQLVAGETGVKLTAFLACGEPLEPCVCVRVYVCVCVFVCVWLTLVVMAGLLAVVCAAVALRLQVRCAIR